MRSLILFFVVIALVGCEPKGFFPYTFEKIEAREKAARGEIFLVQGQRWGMFKEGPVAVGNVNAEGSLRVETKYGGPGVVNWPATPGYYYEASSYVNELEECLLVVRKVKAG